MNDAIKVFFLALKGTFLEPVGTAVEKTLTDGRYTVNEGADLVDLFVKQAGVFFPNPADAPERDLAKAIAAAFAAYHDAKIVQAKEAAALQAKNDAEAPAKAAADAQRKADASKTFAANARKNAEESTKNAATNEHRTTATALTVQADAAQKQALQDQLDADLAKGAATNSAKYKKAPGFAPNQVAKFGPDGVCTVAGYNTTGQYFAVGSKIPSAAPGPVPPVPPVKPAPGPVTL